MKNILILNIAFLLVSAGAYATATQKKCEDGWKESPASKVCKGGQIGEDLSNRRTCLLQGMTCSGTKNGPLSIQPHQLPHLNVCKGFLTIGPCSGPAKNCQQDWDKNPASKLCKGTVQTDPHDPTMCQFNLTCTGVNNGSLTYPPSLIKELHVCDGLLKTGACKS